MLILGIESSCDDTAAAVMRDGKELLSSVLSSQDSIHNHFGGVVPELASRQHLQSITPIVYEALDRAGVTIEEIDLIAVTQGPGLIGSLLVGFCFAKALCYHQNKPCVGVDHMAGHILASFLEEKKPQFPFVALTVSGGTSSIFLASSFTEFNHLGRTRDDAAGEAFDKVAKLLGLPYPGGPVVSKTAESGNSEAIKFPRAWLEEDSLDFSFSGVKTAVLNHCHQQKQKDLPLHLPDICASFEQAVVDVLVEKTIRAARQNNVKTVVIGGGVSANKRLRKAMEERCRKENLSFFAPRPSFCTDNAAMIALAGYHKFQTGSTLKLDDDVFSRSLLG